MNEPNTASKRAPQAAPAPAPQDFESRVAQVLDIVYRHPRHRELYYKTLAFAREERDLDAAEQFIEAQPEYASALQTSSVLVDVLIKEGGLAYYEYDAQGERLTDERIRDLEACGASEDDLFDLVARRTVVTTPAGSAAADLVDPVKRVRAYATNVPARTHVYRTLLDFCTTPRSLEEINALLADDPALKPSARTAHQRLHASYFIDRMNEAGGLVWRNGWVMTEAGRTLLASVDEYHYPTRRNGKTRG